ncbi:MAG: NifB/NifX family molybdenum-iron cluster-binding protein [Desulfatiglandaceae bacterium]
MKKIIFILSIIFFLPVFAFAEAEGKIAIAVEGKSPTAEVSQAAGRSPYFLIFDRSGNLLKTIDNPHKADRRRAGASVVVFLAQKGVTFISAGEFGERMIQAMRNDGMRYLEFQGVAEDALKQILLQLGES